jgi:hypothetical protein
MIVYRYRRSFQHTQYFNHHGHYQQFRIIIGELDYLTAKIITLLEFFNFVSEVSRLQYTSD